MGKNTIGSEDPAVYYQDNLRYPPIPPMSWQFNPTSRAMRKAGLRTYTKLTVVCSENYS